VKRTLLALTLAAAALACAPAAPNFTYRTPEVVDESALLARLRPEKDGELVLANFWASW
jgi:hypothetical protein